MAYFPASLFSRKKSSKSINQPKHFKSMKKNLSAKDCGVKSALWDKFLDLMKKSLILSIFLFNIVAFAYSQNVTINERNQYVSAVLKTIKRKKFKIGILGLNPHNGENGYIGTEEKKIITPSIKKLKKKIFNNRSVVT